MLKIWTEIIIIIFLNMLLFHNILTKLRGNNQLPLLTLTHSKRKEKEWHMLNGLFIKRDSKDMTGNHMEKGNRTSNWSSFAEH